MIKKYQQRAQRTRRVIPTRKQLQYLHHLHCERKHQGVPENRDQLFDYKELTAC